MFRYGKHMKWGANRGPWTLWFAYLVSLLMAAGMVTAGANPTGDDPATIPPAGTEFPGGPFNSPTSETTTGPNSDGIFTFEQVVNGSSTSPHYVAPSSGGFGIYSGFDEDYGWLHDFPNWNDPNLLILDTTLTIRAWDVDSEVSHGTNGEFDGVSGDGVWLNPQYLQGTNNTWSVTDFNVDPNSILDDGNLNVFLNIDMTHTFRYWLTTVDYSKLTITYIYSDNSPPYQPVLQVTPTPCVGVTDDLVVTVTGPTPADPDDDPVTYEYRWLVDTGTEFYVDDEFAGRGDHTGNTVPGTDTVVGDLWKVEVTPIGTFEPVTGVFIGAKGPAAVAEFGAVVTICNQPPTADPNGPYSGDEGSAIALDGTGSSDPDGDPLTYSWSVDSALCSFDDATSATPNLTCTDNGSFTVTLVVDDGQATDSDTTTVEVANVSPSFTYGPVGYSTWENFSGGIRGCVHDPGANDTLLITVDWQDGSTDTFAPQWPNGCWGTSDYFYRDHQYLDDDPTGTPSDVYPVSVTVSDDEGGTSTATAPLTVYNVNPVVGAVAGMPAGPIPVGALLELSAPFTDVGTLDTHTAVWDWGDGTTSAGTVAESGGSGTASGDHSYTVAGIYTVTVTVTDDDTGTGSSTAEAQVVVYDPAGGFVTGGGWIDSPEGAYAADYTTCGAASSAAAALAAEASGSEKEASVAATLAATEAASIDYTLINGCTPYTDGDGLQGVTDFHNIGTPDTWEFYRFYGIQGETADIEVHRTTSAMDPAMMLCFGTADDTTGLSAFLGCGPDMTWVAAADDNNGIPHSVGGNAADPKISTTLPYTGWYTLAVFDYFGAGPGPMVPFELHYSLPDVEFPTGKANFGFVSKYKKGASTPTGNTEFQFHAADLNFHSDSYDWLLVTGSDYARYKGVGTINGELAPNGELFKFMLWAGDGTGTDGADTFRIRIWYEVAGVETVVYDNGMDQAIAGGSIIVHTKK